MSSTDRKDMLTSTTQHVIYTRWYTSLEDRLSSFYEWLTLVMKTLPPSWSTDLYKAVYTYQFNKVPLQLTKWWYFARSVFLGKFSACENPLCMYNTQCEFSHGYCQLPGLVPFFLFVCFYLSLFNIRHNWICIEPKSKYKEIKSSGGLGMIWAPLSWWLTQVALSYKLIETICSPF